MPRSWSWATALSTARRCPANFRLPVRYVGIGSSTPNNLAVAGLSTRLTDGHLSALARVVNHGDQPATATLTLKVDGNQYDAHSLGIGPNASANQEWDDLPPAAHTLEARLTQPDDLALDNAAWAVLGGDRPTRVLLVSDGNVFVERALALRAWHAGHACESWRLHAAEHRRTTCSCWMASPRPACRPERACCCCILRSTTDS